MFRGVSNVDTQSQRQERTSAYSQSQRRGRGSQRRGSGSQQRAGKEHATFGVGSSGSDAASQWRIPGECAVGSRRSCDGFNTYSQGDGSHSSYNQWGSQQGNDWTSEAMEIDSGNSWTSSIRSSLPEISTSLIEEYDGFPMTGFLLWGEQTQVSYNFYVESYLKNFYPQGIDWQHYCNVLMMPQATVALDGTTRGRNSARF
ncbi:hypothetical protein FRX31_030628 [Thalictrum thalictroides]|uniref:Uncharacterized protein n=1 Tax=Thalictrum thalictroides TaxID=46969 RepID=A0A7J6V6H9_THATH|nr:hypothetical protein FRX31_030628 [Thalictrum thalictroides]